MVPERVVYSSFRCFSATARDAAECPLPHARHPQAPPPRPHAQPQHADALPARERLPPARPPPPRTSRTRPPPRRRTTQKRSPIQRQNVLARTRKRARGIRRTRSHHSQRRRPVSADRRDAHKQVPADARLQGRRVVRAQSSGRPRGLDGRRRAGTVGREEVSRAVVVWWWYTDSGA